MFGQFPNEVMVLGAPGPLVQALPCTPVPAAASVVRGPQGTRGQKPEPRVHFLVLGRL